jgi:NADPH2:quinone reductase
VALPDTLPDEIAAALMLKGLTAQYLVKQTFAIKAGHTVLVHAAAGGVGLLLCQWAKALGAFVIGTVGSKDKAQQAQAHGCDVTILYREHAIAEAVKDVTHGQKCDVVYDGVGASTFEASLDCLKPRGLLVSYGNASGPVTGVNLGILAQKGSLYITRPTLFGYANTPEALQAMSADVFEAVHTGLLRVTIGQRWPLSEAATAHRALEARETVGSSILDV